MRLLIDIGLVGIVLALGMAFADIEFRNMHLIVHAKMHIGAAALGLVVVALACRLWLRAAGAVLFALVALWAPLGAVYTFSPGAIAATEPAAGEPIRVLAFNMASAYRGEDLTLAAIAEADADVVVLSEIWREDDVLEALRSDYRHVARCPEGRLCSVAIFSRYPLDEVSGTRAERGWADVLTARLTRNGETVTLAGVHADWPLERWSQRRGLRHVADVVNAIEGSAIVAGDLNTTPWSPEYRTLMEETGLRTLAGYRATWPDYLGPFGVPIDHMFVRGRARIRSLEVMSGNGGSDHRPVVAEIALGEAD